MKTFGSMESATTPKGFKNTNALSANSKRTIMARKLRTKKGKLMKNYSK